MCVEPGPTQMPSWLPAPGSAALVAVDIRRTVMKSGPCDGSEPPKLKLWTVTRAPGAGRNTTFGPVRPATERSDCSPYLPAATWTTSPGAASRLARSKLAHGARFEQEPRRSRRAPRRTTAEFPRPGNGSRAPTSLAAGWTSRTPRERRRATASANGCRHDRPRRPRARGSGNPAHRTRPSAALTRNGRRRLDSGRSRSRDRCPARPARPVRRSAARFATREALAGPMAATGPRGRAEPATSGSRGAPGRGERPPGEPRGRRACRPRLG